MIWLKLWVLSFLLVAVRAFQQKNVMGDHYWRIIPTSYLFAGADLLTLYLGLTQLPHAPLLTIFAMGSGGWMGCWASLYLHRKIGR